MKKFLCFLFISFRLFSAEAQNSAPVTFRDVFVNLKTLKLNKEMTKNERIASGFSFSKFAPDYGKFDSSNYYKICYDSINRISEIKHYVNWMGTKRNRMKVYEFDRFRILLTQIGRESDVWYPYGPIVIVMIKLPKPRYFLINLVYQFEHLPLFEMALDRFPDPEFTSISAIMELDDEMRPLYMLKFLKQAVITRSQFRYDSMRKHWLERGDFYFGENPDLLITEDTSLDWRAPLRGQIQATLVPDVEEGIPFWMYYAEHQYK